MVFLFLAAAILGMHLLPPGSIGAPSTIFAGAVQQSFHTECVIAPDKAPVEISADGINADGMGMSPDGQCSCSGGTHAACMVISASLRINVLTLTPSIASVVTPVRLSRSAAYPYAAVPGTVSRTYLTVSRI